MKSKLALILTLISSPLIAQDYDVIGRDMSYSETSTWSNINWVGHLGIEKNAKVYNMLPSISSKKTITGLDNYLHLTDRNTFKNEGNNYWGTKYEDSTPNDSKIGTFLSLVELAGASYTFYAYNNKNPEVTYNERTKSYSFKRGVLRCDGLVRNALIYGGHEKSSILYPSYVYNNVKNER